MTNDMNKKVIEANIALHTTMAGEYDTCEPHFRPENRHYVGGIVSRMVAETSAKRMLDLGCGTGFMISLAKDKVAEIDGVDVTPAMLARVDTSGPADIRLHESDAGTFPVDRGTYDMVTAYSFLHHLYDPAHVFQTAYDALRIGGLFYADLEPNGYFWDQINALPRDGDFDVIVTREIEAVTHKDEDIQATFGVDPDVFNTAEYSKSITGGFREEQLISDLTTIGFTHVEIMYRWYIGQGVFINEDTYERDERFLHAGVMNDILQRALPVSRSLFKYIGFIATK